MPVEEYLKFLKISQMYGRSLRVVVTDQNLELISKITEKAVHLGGFPFLRLVKGKLGAENKNKVSECEHI
jgi:hypothetical protein